MSFVNRRPVKFVMLKMQQLMVFYKKETCKVSFVKKIPVGGVWLKVRSKKVVCWKYNVNRALKSLLLIETLFEGRM